MCGGVMDVQRTFLGVHKECFVFSSTLTTRHENSQLTLLNRLSQSSISHIQTLPSTLWLRLRRFGESLPLALPLRFRLSEREVYSSESEWAGESAGWSASPCSRWTWR